METSAINAGNTYQTPKGQKLYVHDIVGARVIYCRVGDVTRREINGVRFAAWVETQIPNQ